jgi:hypothetical protein
MNKDKIKAVKSRIKKNLPVVTTSVGLVAISYALYVVHQATEISRGLKSDDFFPLTPDDREAMQTGNVDIRYNIDGQAYSMRHVGNASQQ